MRNKIYTGITVIAAIILISGITIVATASPATQADPLVTLGFLNNIFRPSIMNTEVANTRVQLQNQVNTRASQVETALANIPTPPSSDVFTQVNLSNGQTLTVAIGNEVILRSGTVGFSGGSLINTTSGAVHNAGNLLTNNLYMTVENGTITASNNAMLLVRRTSNTFSATELEFGFDLSSYEYEELEEEN